MPRLHSLHKGGRVGSGTLAKGVCQTRIRPGTYYWAGVTEPEGEATSLGRLSL